MQCGFCIPGQLIAAHALLDAHPHPTRDEIEEGMAGNLCRCACYEQIFDAIEEVALGVVRSSARAPAAEAAKGAGGAQVGARSTGEGLDQ